jgi:hypothetical protein
VRAETTGHMRTMFAIYWLLILGGLALYWIVGLSG